MGRRLEVQKGQTKLMTIGRLGNVEGIGNEGYKRIDEGDRATKGINK